MLLTDDTAVKTPAVIQVTVMGMTEMEMIVVMEAVGSDGDERPEDNLNLIAVAANIANLSASTKSMIFSKDGWGFSNSRSRDNVPLFCLFFLFFFFLSGILYLFRLSQSQSLMLTKGVMHVVSSHSSSSSIIHILDKTRAQGS